MQSLQGLVTGASGFLGRHVAGGLTAKGHDVKGFDIVQSDVAAGEFVQGDFTSKAELLPALKGMDGVCHIGGIGDVYLAEQDPELAFRVNGFGTQVVCDCCASAGIRTLLYASTWEVYGQPRYQPIDEQHPCNPETPYSISKLAGELIVRNRQLSGDTRQIALRLGTAYGTFMRKTAVVPRFIARASAGEPLVVQGEGSQFRQFTHARDIAEAFAAGLQYSGKSRVFNIVSNNHVTIKELARIVSEQYHVPIEFAPLRGGDPPSAVISSRLASEELRWEAKEEFSRALNELLAYYQLDRDFDRRTGRDAEL